MNTFLHARYQEDTEERRPQGYEEDCAEGYQPQPVKNHLIVMYQQYHLGSFVLKTITLVKL